MEAAGHAGDGTAYLIEEEGIFLVGDYLMASQHPRLINAAATFRDREVDGNLPWVMDMA
ncbi:MAG: hypothetical protein AB7I52_15495 [Rhizobiaceae bacterium]